MQLNMNSTINRLYRDTSIYFSFLDIVSCFFNKSIQVCTEKCKPHAWSFDWLKINSQLVFRLNYFNGHDAEWTINPVSMKNLENG